MISGEAFEGITFLEQKKNKLIPRTVLTGSVFSNAVFIDMNNDDFPDIVAHDISGNKLQIYFNDSKGNFRFVKDISLQDKFYNLYSYDFNLDSYPDIIFSAGKSIYILCGDSVASYKKEIKIQTKFSAEKFIVGDFNKNGKVDIAYLNKEESIISVIFQISELEYSSELTYLANKGLTDLIPFYSKYLTGFAGLSAEGKIFVITKLAAYSYDTKLKLAGDPDIIYSADINDDGIMDISYIDTSASSLNLIISNKEGLPALLFNIPIYNCYQKLITFNISKNNKGFYLISEDKGIIEFILFNSNTYKISRDFISCKGRIEEFYLAKEKGNKFPLINIVGLLDNQIFYSLYYHNNRYILKKGYSLNGNFFSPILLNKSVMAWTEENGKLYLNKIELKNFSLSKKYPFLTTNQKISLNLSFELFNDGRNRLFSLSEKDEYIYSIVTNDRDIPIIRRYNKPFSFANIKESNIFRSGVKHNYLRKIFLYVDYLGVLYSLDFWEKGKELNFTELTQISNLGSFCLSILNPNNLFLVGSDKLLKCIIIKKI